VVASPSGGEARSQSLRRLTRTHDRLFFFRWINPADAAIKSVAWTMPRAAVALSPQACSALRRLKTYLSLCWTWDPAVWGYLTWHAVSDANQVQFRLSAFAL